MYPCGNCRAAAVGPDGRCAACGTYQQTLQQAQQPAAPAGYGYPAPGAPAPVPGLPTGGVDLRRGLATSLQVVLGLLLALLVLAFVADIGLYSTTSDMLDGKLVSRDDLEDADDFYRFSMIFVYVVLAVSGILWAIWFRRLRLNAEVFAPGQHRFGPGWAAGSWFTPVVNLWFPKQIANDIWRASSPQGPYAVRRGVLNGWWVLWLIGANCLSGGFSAFASKRGEVTDPDAGTTLQELHDDWESLNDMLAFNVVAILLFAAATILALLLVRQITTMQEQRAALPPQPGPAGYGPGYAAPPGYPVQPGYPAPAAPPYDPTGAAGVPGQQAPYGGQPGPYGSPPPGQPYSPYGQG
ncbi:DUF4328 domain-containing protein [Streptomyces sp. B1866]|uniref:DUF4328 domain-containing protein n=1 Tax=Streptomyces sp. B1866 TaxID=3075431 RepID=UPI002891A0E1|nr:DUF4328 domain-containing protein [Streptomyces sp. B1866]MDT3397447.1 DUF4328 domain-containing protein [Streptomyces sp. B1866]